jgi:hypothetical protein
MLDVNLGTLPDWLAAAGTVGAFWVTYLLLRKEQKARREFEAEQREAQARLVSAWTTFPQQALPYSDIQVADLVVKNMSTEPVYDLRATLIPYSKLPEDDPEGAIGPGVLRFTSASCRPRNAARPASRTSLPSRWRSSWPLPTHAAASGSGSTTGS